MRLTRLEDNLWELHISLLIYQYSGYRSTYKAVDKAVLVLFALLWSKPSGLLCHEAVESSLRSSAAYYSPRKMFDLHRFPYQ